MKTNQLFLAGTRFLAKLFATVLLGLLLGTAYNERSILVNIDETLVSQFIENNEPTEVAKEVIIKHDSKDELEFTKIIAVESNNNAMTCDVYSYISLKTDVPNVFERPAMEINKQRPETYSFLLDKPPRLDSINTS